MIGMDQHEIQVTSDQIDLLEHLTSVAAASNVWRFRCGFLFEAPFAWVVHDSDIARTRVAYWDDLLALNWLGFIDLFLGNEGPDECLLVVTDFARKSYRQRFWELRDPRTGIQING